MSEQPPTQAQSIARAALLLAFANLLSRVLGFGRDWLLSYAFGASGQTDVYQASFTLPDLLNHLLAGGALSVSLLPRMSRLYADERDLPAGAPRESDRVFSIIFNLMAFAAALFVVVAWLAAEPLTALWYKDFTRQQIADTVRLTRIVLPAQLFFLTGGLIQACLLARQSFKAMALTPLLYNAGIIAGGVVGTATGWIDGFSWGALLGAGLGGLAVPAWSARKSLRLQWIFEPGHPEVRAFLWMALPLIVGVSLTTVDDWLGKRFGSGLTPGSISQLSMARKVMLVPIGLLGTAAGQAAGSYIAKLHAEGKKQELAQTLASSLAAVVGLSLVLSGVLMACALPVVQVLFRYGRFGASDAEATANALVPLAAGIAAWGAQSVLARAFFAVGDTWRPMLATTVVTVGMVPLYAIGAQWQGHELQGLALAGTAGIAMQALSLSVLARRFLGLDLQAFGRGVLRGLAVAMASGGLALAVRLLVAPLLPSDWPLPVQALVTLVCAGVPWLLAFVALGTLLQMPGMPRQVLALRGRLATRIKRLRRV
jgi:putative peptidoglycan lipid II flippase